jgi:hypothetical protein
LPLLVHEKPGDRLPEKLRRYPWENIALNSSNCMVICFQKRTAWHCDFHELEKQFHSVHRTSS